MQRTVFQLRRCWVEIPATPVSQAINLRNIESLNQDVKFILHPLDHGVIHIYTWFVTPFSQPKILWGPVMARSVAGYWVELGSVDWSYMADSAPQQIGTLGHYKQPLCHFNLVPLTNLPMQPRVHLWGIFLHYEKRGLTALSKTSVQEDRVLCFDGHLHWQDLYEGGTKKLGRQ